MQKAKEFYIDPIAIGVEPDTPYYIGIKKDEIEFHLSEHHGDSVPGLRVFIVCNNLKQYHASLKPYKYYRPSVEKTFYNAWEMQVQDPFGNKLSFKEYLQQP